jgi:hypothetical protein
MLSHALVAIEANLFAQLGKEYSLYGGQPIETAIGRADQPNAKGYLF